jgi:hypothetical protein
MCNILLIIGRLLVPFPLAIFSPFSFGYFLVLFPLAILVPFPLAIFSPFSFWLFLVPFPLAIFSPFYFDYWLLKYIIVTYHLGT